ncbi:MAG: acyl-CoA thioesterase [Acidobacteria bacterium]|nr:acyl-CoA thioesterase [Acidobacteriota bacterium]
MSVKKGATPVEYVQCFRIRFMDTDLSGRVHYAAIFRYFEAAEHELLRMLRFPYSRLHTLHRIQAPRVNVWADFKRPLQYDDEVEVRCHVASVGNTSFTFGYRIYKDRVLTVEGGLTAVTVDEGGKPIEHPSEFREALKRGLGTVSSKRSDKRR